MSNASEPMVVIPTRRCAGCVFAIALAAWFGASLHAPSAHAQPAPPAPAPVINAPLESAEVVCPKLDLVRNAVISVAGTRSGAPPAQDGRFAQEGALWNGQHAVVLRSPKPELVVDLRAAYLLRRLVVQGDDNDNYGFEASLDGSSYTPLWTAPRSKSGQGLRTRWVELESETRARFLRVRGSGGDGFFSISELRAYCGATPAEWPPVLNVPPTASGWRAIDNDGMVTIKAWAAAFAALVLLAWWASPRYRALRRACDGLLALCGLLALASWWNLGHFHFDQHVHIWEHYHYYIGAKYGPELRYARLYECTAAADLADGLRERVVKRPMRDLARNNELGSSDAIVADPTRCTRHFSAQRWDDFRKDIRFFRGHFSQARWDESQNDHGYNGTPVWAIAGRFIADHGTLTWDKVERIAWIDSALLLVMWAVSWWAFGWRATCVALLWWGFNFPARYWWNGGSMLRFDWLFWMVIGICLLKKERHVGAGMALTYATLLRVFPAFVVAALVLKALGTMVRERRFTLSGEHTRFAAGCIVAGCVLMPLSGWATGGLDAWGEFAHNSEKHLRTPLTNNMGLKTVLGFDYDTRAEAMREPEGKSSDPFAAWKAARAHFYDQRRPVLIGVLLLVCLMIARAGRREPDWVVACLGAGLIALSAELTCYYYGFLLAYGLLWERHKAPAIAVTALAGLTCLFYFMWDWNDVHFAAMSLATSVVVIASTAWIAFRRSSPVAVEQREQASRPLTFSATRENSPADAARITPSVRKSSMLAR
jgi:hypothetical protein